MNLHYVTEDKIIFVMNLPEDKMTHLPEEKKSYMYQLTKLHMCIDLISVLYYESVQ